MKPIEAKFNFNVISFLRKMLSIPISKVPHDLRFLLTHLKYLKVVNELYYNFPGPFNYNNFFSDIEPNDFKRYIDSLKTEPAIKKLFHEIYDDALEDINFFVPKLFFWHQDNLLYTFDFTKIKDPFLRQLMFDFVAYLVHYGDEGNVTQSSRFVTLTDEVIRNGNNVKINLLFKFEPNENDIALMKKNKVKDIFKFVNPYDKLILIYTPTDLSIINHKEIISKKFVSIEIDGILFSSTLMSIAYQYFLNAEVYYDPTFLKEYLLTL
jgi:hypothetical protein